MTWPLVILRVPLEAYVAIKHALILAGSEGKLRIDNPTHNHLNLDGVALEPIPVRDEGLWPCCGFARTGGHNSSCAFYGCDEIKSEDRVCADCGSPFIHHPHSGCKIPVPKEGEQ